MAKKKFNWKKFKKKAIKANKKVGKWVNANINPDVLSGNTDRIFAPQGQFGFGNQEDEGDYQIRGIDWETEMFGHSRHSGERRTTHHRKKKRSSSGSKGKTITIKL